MKRLPQAALDDAARPAPTPSHKTLLNNCAGSPVRARELVLEPYQAVVMELRRQ